jgi:hypothetical protein
MFVNPKRQRKVPIRSSRPRILDLLAEFHNSTDWTHCYDEWINRNNSLHGYNEQFKTQARTTRAKYKIRALYSSRHHCSAQLGPKTKSELFTVRASQLASLHKHMSQDKRILDIWRIGLHQTKLESSVKPSTTHANWSARHWRLLSTHHVTQHLYWEFCTPSSRWRILVCHPYVTRSVHSWARQGRLMKYGHNYRSCWRDHLHVRELARSWTRSRARLLKWYLYHEHNKWHKLERWHPNREHQLVNMYTYMHVSVDQQVTKITDTYATVTMYETFGQSTISIKTDAYTLTNNKSLLMFSIIQFKFVWSRNCFFW